MKILTAMISNITNDYIAYHDTTEDDRHYFKIEDMASRWEIEVLFYLSNDLKPMTINAWYEGKGDCFMKFQDSASYKGYERVAKWLDAMLTLNL